jgi:Region found in RelA / SpoT proteins
MVAGVDEYIARMVPAHEWDYRTIEAAIQQAYSQWGTFLTDAQAELEAAITELHFRLVAGGERGEVLRGKRALLRVEAVVVARLKTVEAIVGKMRRFGEPLFNMLDIWGYRVIVSDVESLEKVLPVVAGMWSAPTTEELALRGGTLQFDWLRDYRARSHAGLSDATSPRYDEAVHVNRRAPFGVVEVQVVTLDLYRRAYAGTGEEAHASFVTRRRALEEAGQEKHRRGGR